MAVLQDVKNGKATSMAELQAQITNACPVLLLSESYSLGNNRETGDDC
jgi:hypothetical protein